MAPFWLTVLFPSLKGDKGGLESNALYLRLRLQNKPYPLFPLLRKCPVELRARSILHAVDPVVLLLAPWNLASIWMMKVAAPVLDQDVMYSNHEFYAQLYFWGHISFVFSTLFLSIRLIAMPFGPPCRRLLANAKCEPWARELYLSAIYPQEYDVAIFAYAMTVAVRRALWILAVVIICAAIYRTYGSGALVSSMFNAETYDTLWWIVVCFLEFVSLSSAWIALSIFWCAERAQVESAIARFLGDLLEIALLLLLHLPALVIGWVLALLFEIARRNGSIPEIVIVTGLWIVMPLITFFAAIAVTNYLFYEEKAELGRAFAVAVVED